MDFMAVTASPTALPLSLAGNTAEKIIIDYNGNPVLSAYTPLKVYDTDWALLAEIDEAEVRAPINAMIFSILIAGVVIAAIVVIIALFVALSIAKPVIKGVAVTKAIAAGDLTVEVDIDQKDEIGMLADSLKEMLTRLREIVYGVKEASNNVASGSGELSSSAQEMSQGAPNRRPRPRRCHRP